MTPNYGDDNELLAVAREWMRVGWQEPEPAAFRQLHADLFTDHSSAGRPPDRDGFWAGVVDWFAAFPDLAVTADDVFADRDRRLVTVRWSAVGTHSGPFLGVAATGRRITFSGIEVIAIDASGRVCERWGEWNGVEILEQLQQPIGFADSMRNEKLKEKLDRSFKLTHELIVHLDEGSLELDLPNLPSNRISGQLWCIVGARQSYIRAIEAGGWQGFACSLTAPRVKQSVLAALEATHKRLDEIDFAGLSDAQMDFAFDLFEHELQHHGQLIRFVYGNSLTFPGSWNERYTV